MGELDASGSSGAIALPDGIRGTYTVIVRVPGFLPAEHHGVELGDGPVSIDFTAGGIVALEPGDLNHDRSIDAQDLAAWLRLWWRGSASADLDGDGSASLGDLPLVLRRLGEGDA